MNINDRVKVKDYDGLSLNPIVLTGRIDSFEKGYFSLTENVQVTIDPDYGDRIFENPVNVLGNSLEKI